MTVYADYAYYRQVYKGSILNEKEFDSSIVRASAYLDTITFGRIATTTTTDDVKCAACAVADVFGMTAQRTISEETVGSYRVTYADDEKNADAQKMDAAKLYLGNSGLLFRGVFDANEC